MVQPRRASAWLLFCILACLIVLSIPPQRPRDVVAKHEAASDLARTIEPVAFQVVEPGRNASAAVEDEQIESEPVSGDGLAAKDAQSGRPSDETSPLHLPTLALTVTADPDPQPSDVAAVVPVASESQPVAPASKIGAKTAEPSILPELIRRLPEVVANLPAAINPVPRDSVQPASEKPFPATDPLGEVSKTPSERAKRDADDSWREPETLLESLNSLATAGATSKWATEVIRQIRALGPAVASGSNESVAILDRLTELNRQVPQLATRISDRALARRFRKTSYALSRRIDVWKGVVLLGVPRPVDNSACDVDAKKLTLCLVEVDSLIGDSPEGQAWRNYLLVDALKELSKRQASAEDRATRQTAQQVLDRLTQMPLTPSQQKFVATGPIAALRSELRRWAAEPVGATAVLRDIETYERTGLPSDAYRLAKDCQNLTFSSVEGRRQLAERVDLHYRNANMRIAVTEELLNKLIPEQNMEYAPVDDTVLGRPVRGESLMATELAVRMLPDPHRVLMMLEVRGEIAAQTTADAGPVRFHNDSESYCVARKPLEIDMNGISTWSTEVGVNNETRLRGVETPLDPIPLLGAGARMLAKSQLQQNQDAASREVKQKVAAQARERIDAEARERLTQVVAHMNQRVFDPLNSLSLDPQMIDGETTDKRFTMRLRLAGEDQLGSHTPRPQAPENSLASVQIHESVLNNGIERLQLNGRTFTLPELSKHIATRLSWPAPWEINPEHADVKITFAEKDAVVVRCQDGQVILKLSIAQLSKPSTGKWKNFQIRAIYRPKVAGRSAELVRTGGIEISPQRMSLRSRTTLGVIFSKALSKNNSRELVPERIVKEPKLADAAITQFDIVDGWIAVAMGPKPPAGTMAKRPRWGTW
jgi:hypothetical protein